MDISKKNLIIFLRSRHILIIFLLGMFIVVSQLIYEASNYTITNDSFWYLHKAQTMCVVIFILNLYITYEYIRGIRMSGIEEVIASHSGGKAKLYVTSLVVIIGLLFIQFLIMFLFPFIIVLIAGTTAILSIHVLSVSVLNTLLPGLLAILMGFFLALKLKRVKAYALMALLIFIITPASDLIPGIANDGYHINIWPIKAFFSDILPPNLTWTIDYQYGLSNEYFRWNIALFWLLIFAGLVLFCILSKKSRLRVLAISLCFALSLVNLYEYSRGSSKIDLSLAPTSVFRTDQVYYRHHEPREEAAKFEISAYNMKLNIDRVLNAEITMELNSPQDLNEYKFTLYNWYKLSGVKDENGTGLNFEQDGDYITIYAEQPVKSITMNYNGYSPMFYSNDQGVCLPGCFPYYPWAGFKKIYYSTPDPKEGLAAFIVHNNLPSVDYTAEINGVKNLQTNLTEANGVFNGRTDGLTIMGGFLEAKKLGKYDAVVCSVSRPGLILTEAYLDSLQEAVTALETERGLQSHVDLSQYRIFQTNETMGRGGYDPVVIFDDYMILNAYSDFDYMAKRLLNQLYEPPPLTIKDYKKMEGRE